MVLMAVVVEAPPLGDDAAAIGTGTGHFCRSSSRKASPLSLRSSLGVVLKQKLRLWLLSRGVVDRRRKSNDERAADPSLSDELCRRGAAVVVVVNAVQHTASQRSERSRTDDRVIMLLGSRERESRGMNGSAEEG